MNIEDYSQDMSFQLLVLHKAKKDFDEKEHPEFFILSGQEEVEAQPTKHSVDPEKSSANDHGDDKIAVKRTRTEDDVEILEIDGETNVPKKKKPRTEAASNQTGKPAPDAPIIELD